MTGADAFTFLSCCLTEELQPARRQVAAAIAARAPDWTVLVDLANRLLVASAVSGSARRSRLDTLMPPDVRDFFDGMATLNAARNRAIRAEIDDVGAAFGRIGVTPVLLKGAAHLVSGLYPGCGDRIMVDIDLLVPAGDLMACAAALQQQGFTVLADNGFPAHHHYPPLGRAGASASVEIHAEALDQPYGELCPAAELLSAAQPVAGASNLALPSAQSQLIVSVAHAELANHGYLFGETMLRNLLDTAWLVRRHAGVIDWAALAARFRRRHAATALACHFLAAERLLDLPMPAGLQVNRTARMLDRLAARQNLATDSLRKRSLRPLLQLRRAVATPALRRRLLRRLHEPAWIARHVRLLGGRPQRRGSE